MGHQHRSLVTFLLPITLCIGLAAVFFFAWQTSYVELLRSDEFIIGITLFACALVAVIVYQATVVQHTAVRIARAMAEGMLVHSKELFTELYRGSPVPYLVMDAHATIESANLAAVRLFGVQNGWFEGKHVFDLIAPESDERTALFVEYFSRTMAIHDEEVRIVRPDGGIRWVMLSLFSFMDGNREQKGLLTLVDVTKQKEVDKAKTEFVSLASHQLRTPISAMKWNLELFTAAGKDHLTDIERSYLDKIARGVGRMDALVADFLSVSKLELGTFVPQYASLPVPSFMESILESHEKNAQVRGITIEREWRDDDVVVSDARLLEMAVNNLISNAIKYSKEHGLVRIAFHTDGRHVVIAVSDSGIGIPKEEHDHIFSKIYRASNAKAEVPDGTGLGLYIVREAIRVMGGDVTFVSSLGEGSTFTIVLPTR